MASAPCASQIRIDSECVGSADGLRVTQSQDPLQGYPSDVYDNADDD